MSGTLRLPAHLQAPAHWRVLDFISDVHLQSREPATAQAWADYLTRTHADAVFILGDLFEVWVGDDALTSPEFEFEADCVSLLARTARQRALFLMHGNRDFLMGHDLARACGATLLDDPCVLQWGTQNWLLSHGDALCLDDTDYQQFRVQVRSTSWQHAFLARPLAERQAIARGLREQSENRKRQQLPYADVDAAAARQALHAAQAQALIHGHTHRPADHELGDGLRRHVLSDWDTAATPLRAQVLRLVAGDVTGPARLQRLPLSSLMDHGAGNQAGPAT